MQPIFYEAFAVILGIGLAAFAVAATFWSAAWLAELTYPLRKRAEETVERWAGYRQ